jgi:predicted TIM-barrel fold metal-dependent hydrolase
MTGFLAPDEKRRLRPAETAAFPGPIPTQIVASDEYLPEPQSPQQRAVEQRIKQFGARMAHRLGISRREFFASSAGMAASFLAMNEIYGALFATSPAEASTPELADERARGLRDQFILDDHTHFLRDDTRLISFAQMRQAMGAAGWNPQLASKEQGLDDLKFNNYYKEIYLDSDTKVALISSAPSDIPRDWFLTNDMMADARAHVNKAAGARRMLSHAIFTPGQPGWLESIDHAISLRPDSFKGYTIGDNTHKELARYPWLMDDEKLTYRGYEKFDRAGIRIVCVHKGLFPPSIEQQFPRLRPYVDVSDVGKAARDWPQLDFVIYHSGYRHTGETSAPDVALAQLERTGRVEWVTDLAELPAKYGVNNVYGDLGQLFAYAIVSHPRLAAYMLGVLIKGLGADHVLWGTDALWSGSPQWQIEGLRRLEIPEDMQKKFGFAPLGPATGAVKTAILGGNSARLYRYHAPTALATDRFAAHKQQYCEAGPQRSNLRYGYVAASS